MQQLLTRPAAPSDHNFVYATYLRNRWYDTLNTTTLQKDTWMRIQHGRLEKMLASQPVLVVCLSEDPEVILGYKLLDGSEVWSYVKKDWRIPEVLKMLEGAAL